jgi:hypothetical protein
VLMSDLSGTLPQTQNAYAGLASYASSNGITIGIADFGGIRTQSDTTTILADRQNDYNADVAAGRISADTPINKYRPIAPFGKSYHNYGAAFDVAIIARPSSMSEDGALALLGGYAPNLGLTWGGTFSNPDPDHFQLDVSLDDAMAMYGGGPADDGGTSATLDSSLILGFLIVGIIAWSVRRQFT